MGSRRIQGPLVVNGSTVFIAAGNYSLVNESRAFINKTSGAATQVTLPASSPIGREVLVVDMKGDAATNNITVVPAAGTINGGASFVIGENYGKMAFVYNGTEWNQSLSSEVSAAELAFLNGVTAGTVTASKALVVDASKDLSALRNLTLTNLDAGASGTAGTVDVFPTTASKGKTSLTASDNSGNTTTTINTAAQTGARTYTVPDAGASASVALLTGGQSVAGVLSRADLASEAAVAHMVSLIDLKVWDALHTDIPGTAATDDLALVTGTFLTAQPVVQTDDSKAASHTMRTRFQFVVPEHYVAGGAINLRLNAGMVTTISDTTATIDAEVVRVAAPSVDICATAATTINSLTAANKDFTLTPTSVVVGDILDVRLTIAIVDAATATAVIGQLNSINLQLATKG